MNIMEHAGPMRVVTIGFEPGEMLLESIKEAIAKAGVENGVVVSGIGTLKSCQMHYVTHTDFPAVDRFYTLQKPLELLSVNGIIADGEPHLHIVVSCGEKEVYAGHLENNSEVLYLAEIAVLEFNELKMTRHLDPEKKTSLLGPKLP
ncbi:MAG: DNA-binding protein [Deltaproteobacteria bacterium]|nr:DNA-binding protein [Deltaproteobacteria bacterium]